MSRAISGRAVELATGHPATSTERVAAGRSSTAWRAETGGRSWIVRIPIEGSGRRITYAVESFLGEQLAALGHPVPTWTVVDVDGVRCSVGPELPGTPVGYGVAWTPAFAERLGAVLTDLHRLPADGFGPLEDIDTAATGISPSRRSGIVDRWFHARVWPFDASSLDDRPISTQAPDLVDTVTGLRTAIEAAEDGTIGVVHSDLHREHLLVNGDGELTALLDLGDAFVGAVAWDFALLAWYFGVDNARLVAAHHPNGDGELERGLLLTISVGLYKLDKTPSDRAVVPRLRRAVETATRPG